MRGVMSDAPNNPLPPRKAGRPKGSKNRVVGVKARTKVKGAPVVIAPKAFSQTRLQIPLIPLVHRAKKMYWHILNIERHLEADPLFISPKEYFGLLKEMEAVYTELDKQKLGTNEQRKQARQRVQSKRVAEDGDGIATSRVGQDKPLGVDNGIPTPDPFGRKR